MRVGNKHRKQQSNTSQAITHGTGGLARDPAKEKERKTGNEHSSLEYEMFAKKKKTLAEKA